MPPTMTVAATGGVVEPASPKMAKPPIKNDVISPTIALIQKPEPSSADLVLPSWIAVDEQFLQRDSCSRRAAPQSLQILFSDVTRGIYVDVATFGALLAPSATLCAAS